uniref:Ferrochelatase n=1 Tax=Candidatus Kentrum sp. TUN TaxID=2126343 RepID=A0A451A1D2_9GAMM|nr:MAG: ferrochelatase [Candidatus Kentron sp. TUN]VFK59840.1 MAG: ferrochelatase [Candidatus Kentron sp. TUN]VFK68676.1 MAG: ferrochelatase [Candidatus Kentron sp. TUN]
MSVNNPLRTTDDPVGILVTNLGTPAAPTRRAIRKYLSEFLWDRRVVDTPRLIWWPILHGIVLRVRPAKSASIYRNIWTQEGSPLLVISKRQVSALQATLDEQCPVPVRVMLGMRYGEPSLGDALKQLQADGIRRLLVLPLYPQYSASTTASTFDMVTKELKNWRWLPTLRFINGYHDHEGYIGALCETIRQAWTERKPPERLLFSFHGLPKRYTENGDPYHDECQTTAHWVARGLSLPDRKWMISFQSRVGREEWLTPHTDELLRAWGREGTKSVDVICPGFSADCVETLEEIEIRGQDIFRSAGGGAFHYIPGLNDQSVHIRALADLVRIHAGNWLTGDT